MKISVSTDGKDVTVDMEKEKGDRIFNKLVAMLLQPDTANNNPESFVTPKQGKKTEKPEEEYKGFIYMKCPKCGKVEGFCTKGIREYRCGCGHITPLHDLKPLYVNCQCGQKFKYMTNMDEDMFDVKCIECGNPVAVLWNSKKMIYQTIM